MEQTTSRAPLTPEELNLLTSIRTYIDRHEFPPTIRQLGVWAGTSTTGTYRLLVALREKGYITRGPTRTMKIIP